MRFAAILLSLFAHLCVLHAAGVDVGQYDNPRDLTLKIHDPYAQDNIDLMQPVVGDYSIRILPPYIGSNERPDEYRAEGLYFKQVGKLIYIDIRKPPKQTQAGEFDLAVSLSVPGEPVSSNRLRRHIIYTDSATDVLLVVDNSRSMKKNDPRGLRFEACENFVHLASLSQRIQNIGVIKFSGSAKVVLPWSSPSLANKKRVGKALSSSRPGNFTNINEAFELSAEMFEDSVATEKVVVLLTDGKNEPDIYRDTHELLQDMGVRVYTVGLSNQSDAGQLSAISTETGGEFFKAVDDKKLIRIYNKIAQQLSEAKLVAEGKDVQQVKFPVTSHDEFIDINVYNFNRNQKIQILDENGADVPFFSIVGRSKDSAVLLRLSKPKPGLYQLKLSGGSPFSYDVNSVSQLYLKMFPLEKKYLRGELAHFAVSLARRQNPMIDAQIQGVLSREDGSVIGSMRLYDDGVHGDNHANDGVYCAIYPLDLQEGRYQLTVTAEGKTSRGEPYRRVLRDSFYMLEASQPKKDYFLASVLPLYVDYGNLEQGTVAKASLRVSFEGRAERNIEILAGDPMLQSSGATFPWEAFEFPESITMTPSVPEVVTIKLKVPLKAEIGDYSGSVLIRMGDQEIWVPVDLSVKKAALARQAPVFRQPNQPQPVEKALVRDTAKGLALPTPDVMVEFKPLEGAKDLKLGPSAAQSASFIPKEPEPEPEVVEVVEALPPIDFKVSPAAIPEFELEQGQYASMIFKIKNVSAYAGNLQVNLDGMGELESTFIELEAGEEIDWSWGWDVVEVEGASREIQLNFSNARQREARVLKWKLPPPIPPIFFYVTLAILAFIFVVYGVRFIFSHDPPHAFVSSSALLHLLIVIWAFATFLPPRPLVDEEDPPIVTFEMLPEETFSPDEVEETMLKEEEQVEMRPQETEEIVQAVDLSVPRPTQALEKKQLEREQPQVQERKVELQVAREPLPSREREIEVQSMKQDVEIAVMSVNDRPWKRATLRRAEPREVKPQEMKVEARESAIVRQRVDLDRDVQEKDLDLQSLNREMLVPNMKQRQRVAEMDQPELTAPKSSLDLSEEVESLVMRAESGEILTPSEVLELDKATVEALRQRIGDVASQQLMSGNVSLRDLSQRQVSALQSVDLSSREAESMQVQSQRLEVSDTVAKLSVREAQERGVAERAEVKLEYSESSFEAEKSSASRATVGRTSAGEVELRSGFERRQPSALPGKKMTVLNQDMADRSVLTKVSAPKALGVASEDVSASLGLQKRQERTIAQGSEVQVSKQDLVQDLDREETQMERREFSPERLEKKELMNPVRRAPIIRERGVGKTTRSTLPSRMLPMRRETALPKKP